MSSLLTNTSAMVALSTLRGINDDMATTQNRISTGMRVSDASDNAAYWSIATTMRADNTALGAVKDAIGLGAATVDVAFTAVDKAVDVMKDVVRDLTTATGDTVDKGKIQSAMTNAQGQLKTIAASASFSGDNWLQQDKSAATLTKEITGSFNRDANGAATIETIDVNTDKIVLVDTRGATAGDNTGIFSKDLIGDDFVVDGIRVTVGAGGVDWSTLTFTDGAATPKELSGMKIDAYRQMILDHVAKDGVTAPTTQAEVNELFKTVSGTKGALEDEATAMNDAFTRLDGNSILDFDVARLGTTGADKKVMVAVIGAFDTQLKELTNAATDLGSAKARVDMQKEFVSSLTDAIDRGIGQLVDADMNAESTRLKALQTQQQLGIQALSIANTGSQNILSLFR